MSGVRSGRTSERNGTRGFEKLWAGGHLNEMYVRDVKCDRKGKYLGLKGI